MAGALVEAEERGVNEYGEDESDDVGLHFLDACGLAQR
jgi:hypothetical protein